MTRLTPWVACREGMRRATRAWRAVLLVSAVTLVATAPLAVEVARDVERQLGDSMDAAAQASGVTYDWLSEFGDQATGTGASLGPAVIGFAAVVDNVSTFLDGERQPVTVAVAGAVYALAWLFLSGGLVDRLARDRALRAHGFFQACGGYFGRLLRLGALAAVAYGVLLLRVHPYLLDRTFDRFTEDLDVERTAFAIRLALYAAFVILLAAVNLWFDYAKVRLIVEDRTSAIGALRAAARFVARHAPGTLLLYLLNALVFASVLTLYALLAPGAAWTWWAFAVGQLYVVARIWAKLVFWGSAAAWFQDRLAHARYTAAPVPVWPDSAAAEALDSRYTLLSHDRSTEAS